MRKSYIGFWSVENHYYCAAPVNVLHPFETLHQKTGFIKNLHITKSQAPISRSLFVTQQYSLSGGIVRASAKAAQLGEQ